MEQTQKKYPYNKLVKTKTFTHYSFQFDSKYWLRLLLWEYTNAKLPYLDSATTTFSLFATYMVTKKVIENWMYWVVIDIASIYLYYSRDLTISAGLFALYVVLATIGYFQWKKKMAWKK